MIPAPVLAMVAASCWPWVPSLLLLFVGRVFSGLALGSAWAVGASSIEELSEKPYEDARARLGSGAPPCP
ncbi:hypothetical protein QJS66_11265 [Kocuria rhizophila]|nr:hypothetical protein QJS66_11265 [Kocuria rhizophila]